MFSTLETSENSGRPRELFWFMRGIEEWTYTSTGTPIDFQLKTFEPVAGLTRTNIKDSNESSRTQMTIELPRDNAVAQLFNGVPTGDAIWVNIYAIHDGDSDYTVSWQGRIRVCDFQGSKAVLTLDTLLASTKQNSLRHYYQNQCNNVIFDANCGLSEATFSIPSQAIASVDHNVVTVINSQAADFFRAGQIKRANGDRRFIITDTVASGVHTLTLLQPFEDLAVGESVTLIGGACLHTFDSCQAVKLPGGSTEDNSENYGGYPKVPRKNPFKSFN
jgi:uncharacterized phage protein (TIGR02218 family)